MYSGCGQKPSWNLGGLVLVVSGFGDFEYCFVGLFVSFWVVKLLFLGCGIWIVACASMLKIVASIINLMDLVRYVKVSMV